jgi:hypothetical protein
MPELAGLELECVPLANMGIREILSPKFQPLSISTLPGSRRIEFDWRALWYALRASGIELLTLKAWVSENALLYTGLHILFLMHDHITAHFVPIPDSKVDSVMDLTRRRHYRNVHLYEI